MAQEKIEAPLTGKVMSVDVKAGDTIQEGDVILSSGRDKIFPKGLLLGKVIRSRKTSGAFYSIDVEPAADLFHVEEVSVLLMGP